jgi:transcriptional regulator NrdR family protein
MHGVREKYENEQLENAMKATIEKSAMDPEEMRQKGLI